MRVGGGPDWRRVLWRLRTEGRVRVGDGGGMAVGSIGLVGRQLGGGYLGGLRGTTAGQARSGGGVGEALRGAGGRAGGRAGGAKIAKARHPRRSEGGKTRILSPSLLPG